MAATAKDTTQGNLSSDYSLNERAGFRLSSNPQESRNQSASATSATGRDRQFEDLNQLTIPKPLPSTTDAMKVFRSLPFEEMKDPRTKAIANLAHDYDGAIANYMSEPSLLGWWLGEKRSPDVSLASHRQSVIKSLERLNSIVQSVERSLDPVDKKLINEVDDIVRNVQKDSGHFCARYSQLVRETDKGPGGFYTSGKESLTPYLASGGMPPSFRWDADNLAAALKDLFAERAQVLATTPDRTASKLTDSPVESKSRYQAREIQSGDSRDIFSVKVLEMFQGIDEENQKNHERDSSGSKEPTETTKRPLSAADIGEWAQLNSSVEKEVCALIEQRDERTRLLVKEQRNLQVESQRLIPRLSSFFYGLIQDLAGSSQPLITARESDGLKKIAQIRGQLANIHLKLKEATENIQTSEQVGGKIISGEITNIPKALRLASIPVALQGKLITRERLYSVIEGSIATSISENQRTPHAVRSVNSDSIEFQTRNDKGDEIAVRFVYRREGKVTVSTRAGESSEFTELGGMWNDTALKFALRFLENNEIPKTISGQRNGDRVIEKVRFAANVLRDD